jgi:hypothetical protein
LLILLPSLHSNLSLSHFNLSLVLFSSLAIGVAEGDNVATDSRIVAAINILLTNNKIRVETSAARSGEVIIKILVILVEIIKGRGDVIDYYRVDSYKFECLK